MGVFDQMANQLVRTASGQAARYASAQLSDLATTGLQSLFGVSLLDSGTGVLPSQFNIDEFRTNLSAHGEVARMDKFNVVIIVPPVVQLASGTSLRELSLQCEVSELPARDVTHIEYRHYGYIRRIPHTNQYGQATFTFIVSGDMWEKRLFDRWLDIMTPTNSGLVSYPLDAQGNQIYEAPITINQYNANGQWIYGAQLIDAIPTSISPLGLDWSSDQPHKLTVTFNFRKWFSDSTTAVVQPTDFGTAVGGAVSTTVATSPINNQTNNPQANVGFFGSPLGQTVVTDLKSTVQTSGLLSPKLRL